jgi:hypothetical protein
MLFSSVCGGCKRLTPILSQWNTSFGTPQPQNSPTSVTAPSSSLSIASSGGLEVPTIQDIQAAQAQAAQLRPGAQQMPTPQYTAPQIQNFVTPAMWQESVASVYEGGMKRAWDYDSHSHMSMKRR